MCPDINECTSKQNDILKESKKEENINEENPNPSLSKKEGKRELKANLKDKMKEKDVDLKKPFKQIFEKKKLENKIYQIMENDNSISNVNFSSSNQNPLEKMNDISKISKDIANIAAPIISNNLKKEDESKMYDNDQKNDDKICESFQNSLLFPLGNDSNNIFCYNGLRNIQNISLDIPFSNGPFDLNCNSISNN